MLYQALEQQLAALATSEGLSFARHIAGNRNILLNIMGDMATIFAQQAQVACHPAEVSAVRNGSVPAAHQLRPVESITKTLISRLSTMLSIGSPSAEYLASPAFATLLGQPNQATPHDAKRRKTNSDDEWKPATRNEAMAKKHNEASGLLVYSGTG